MTLQNPLPSLSVQVINLDRSADRRAKMQVAMDSQGVEFTRLAGIDGKFGPAGTLGNYDPDRSVRVFGRELLPGEVGCYQSHLNAAQAFLDGPEDLGLILEDDIIVPENFAAMIEHLRYLAGWVGLENWHFTQLGQATKKFRRSMQAPAWPTDFPTPYYGFYLPGTTHAIMWSRAGAAEFLDACRDIIMPVDNTIRDHMCLVGTGLGFGETMVQPLNHDSLINDGDPTARKSARSKLSRFDWLARRRRLGSYFNAMRAKRAWKGRA